jgi:hypothetical protein
MKKSDSEGRIWRRRKLAPKLQVATLHRRDDLPPAGRVGDLAELAEIFTTMNRDEDHRADGA